MRQVTEEQTDTVTWSASGNPTADIDNSGLITELVLTAEVTPSATLTAANQVAGLLRVGRNFRVEGGGDTFFELPDEAGGHGSTLLYYLNRLDYGGAGHPDGGVAAPQNSYTPISWWLHCGGRPWNEHDLTAFIPGLDRTNLRLTWTTTANSVMDDTVTISSAVLRIQRSFTLGLQHEILAEMARQGVGLPQSNFHGQPFGQPVTGMMPNWVGNSEAPAATASNFSSTRNPPVDGWIRRISLAGQDATATRPVLADDEVTQARLRLHDETLFEVRLDAQGAKVPYGSNLTANSGASESAGTEKMGADFNNHRPRGIFPLPDLRKIGHPDYGLNVHGVAAGAFQLAITIATNASGDDIFFLYERYKPYFGRLGTN